MFTVSGTGPDGIAYLVRVGAPAASTAHRTGIASGSRHVIELLSAAKGRPVAATPTSTRSPLNVNDPASVLAALYMFTKVTDVDGDDVPDVFDATDEDGNPPPEGAVF